MQNPIPKLCQTTIISKEPVFCLKNWKLWRAPTTIEYNILCWSFAHVFYLIMSKKKVFENYCFISWVINKNVKNECAKSGLFNFCK